MKKTEIKQELLSIGQVAKMLGVHIDTLRRWDREGKLKPIRLGEKGRRRYKIIDIQNLINEKNKGDSNKS